MSTTVDLELPAVVLADLDLPYEGHRGPSDLTVIINALDAVSTVVALATLKPNLEALAAAIKVWLTRPQQRASYTLTIKGNGIHLRLTLGPNTSKAEILKILGKLSAGE
jgi:hypothetical protein